MSGPRTLRSAVVVAFALALAGCPESPVDVELDPPPPPPKDTTPTPPPQPPATVPRGTPVVYIATSSDASVYNHYLGDVIEGSRGAFVQIDQEVGVFARALNGGLWELRGFTTLSGFTAEALHSLDVDDGHVGFVLRGTGGQDAVGLYSSDTDRFQTIAVGTSVNQLQVLYR